MKQKQQPGRVAAEILFTILEVFVANTFEIQRLNVFRLIPSQALSCAGSKGIISGFLGHP